MPVKYKFVIDKYLHIDNKKNKEPKGSKSKRNHKN